MNCKPGDVAIVVRSKAGHEGKVVTCIRFVGNASGYKGDDYWLVDRALPSIYGDTTPVLRDSCLRPIRPGDISDEEVRDLYAPKVPEHA